GIRLVAFWILCAIAMFVHVLVDNKYVGHMAMIVYFVLGVAMPLLGFEHHLYRAGTLPDFKYSAMNGFGPFLAPIVAYEASWRAFGVVLVLLANALWVRGATGGLRARLRAALPAFPRAPLAVALAAFAAIGAYIAWNTNVTNRYESRTSREADRAAWEKKYKAEWEKAPRPRIRAMKLAIDVFPETRKATMAGTYTLENASGAPVTRIAMTMPTDARIVRLSFGRDEKRTIADERL